jgi:tRNA A37 threonylcarbamoyladenosine dehydratase
MERFLRTKALIGEENFSLLQGKTVAVFGVGGVGSYAAESLVRSGVGNIYIYDNDTVAKSNINRQLIANDKTVGEPKVETAKKRYLKINPEANITAVCEFVTPESKIPFEKFDFIIDAIDNVTAKLFLIENAVQKNIPIISSMGTGNKLFPERLKIGDIYKTDTCPLCRVMRTELKKRGIKKLNVVWSDEKPIEPQKIDEENKKTVASCAFVPGSAGLMAAAFAVRTLLNLN